MAIVTGWGGPRVGVSETAAWRPPGLRVEGGAHNPQGAPPRAVPHASLPALCSELPKAEGQVSPLSLLTTGHTCYLRPTPF